LCLRSGIELDVDAVGEQLEGCHGALPDVAGAGMGWSRRVHSDGGSAQSGKRAATHQHDSLIRHHLVAAEGHHEW
jgi:hypothetical protein